MIGSLIARRGHVNFREKRNQTGQCPAGFRPGRWAVRGLASGRIGRKLMSLPGGTANGPSLRLAIAPRQAERARGRPLRTASLRALRRGRFDLSSVNGTFTRRRVRPLHWAVGQARAV